MAYSKNKTVVGVGLPKDLYNFLSDEAKRDIVCDTIPKRILKILEDYRQDKTKKASIHWDDIDPEDISELESRISIFQTVLNNNTSFGEIKKAHTNMYQAWSKLVELRNQSLDNRLPDHMKCRDLIPGMEVTINLDPKIEKLLQTAYELSEKYFKTIGVLRK